MNYLLPAEYEQFGLETATPESWTAAASKMIDAHCRRATLAVAQYVEQMRVTPGKFAVHLSYLPLSGTSPITAARGRYAAPRRGEGTQNEFAFQVAQTFALPGTWTVLDPASLDFDATLGEASFPMHILGLPYNEVEITYNAGLSVIPDEVKFACAQIVRNAQATPALNVKQGRVDTLRLDYFSDSLIDQSVRALLAPYVAQRMG